MFRVYVGNLDKWINERELEDEFIIYGVIKSIWIARRPPGYAFIEFDDDRCAQDAIRALDGKNGWKVEISRNARAREDLKCYKCGVAGHFARECTFRATRRIRSPPPGYGRRSYSPRRRSPKPRSLSLLRPRAISLSQPPYHGRDESPYAYRGRDESPYAYRGRDESPYAYRGRDESPYANGNGRRDRHRRRS